jgi:hypothetical protein
MAATAKPRVAPDAGAVCQNVCRALIGGPVGKVWYDVK